MKSPPTIKDIRFENSDVFELLGLNAEQVVNDDFSSFGWAVVESIALSEKLGRVEVLLDPVLVLALHSSDAPRIQDQIELEFVLDEESETPVSLILAISTFFNSILEPFFIHKQSLPRTIVFALCNPRKLDIVCPPFLGGRDIYFAKGDVESWLDWPGRKNQRIRLHSDTWHHITT